MKMPRYSLNKFRPFLIVFVLAFFAGILSTNAQSEEEDEQEDGFFNGIDKESFKSDFGTDNSQRSIDYSTDGQRGRGDQSNKFDIFGSNKEVPVYKFEEDQSTNNQSGNNGGIIINGGGSSSNMEEIREGGNANMPSVSDPFKQGQTGVKTPRNMDAVPDNGDEPNDVPLDGGISILGLAAVAFGFRKFKTKN
jgi:hypothetical protein